ncbi:Glycosyl transferase family 2 [Pseudobutyrivibrio sp. 49]|uniref:glycosyltransferase family 2 protein n=1 Tax=Pseudobutyrivibrio sp. 49 TaxID=1855344 RepID=UPI00088D7146|nr:glycosyltransferase family 2 protein [Pseudobutyrivibrio sp. 49]SDH60545.1 Glycosyl transferase family 2 [Pseudobutyrivibrio sp. 49]
MSAAVSVIIPVYNKERYLSRCIESVLNQTFHDFELILVDDGSEDNSLNICKKYEEVNNHIVVIHQDNQGVSVARNNGIKAAIGEYILFVDADDYLNEDMIEKMYQSAKDQCVNLVICGYNLIMNNKVKKCSEKTGLYSMSDFMGIMARWRVDPLIGSPCNKLIKRRIILDNMLTYVPNTIYAEDYNFNISLFMHIDKLYVIDNCLYNYDLAVSGSLTKKNTINPNILWKNQTRVLNNILELEKKYERESILSSQFFAEAVTLNFSRRALGGLEEYKEWRDEVLNNLRLKQYIIETKGIAGGGFESFAYKIFRISVMLGFDNLVFYICKIMMNIIYCIKQ